MSASVQAGSECPCVNESALYEYFDKHISSISKDTSDIKFILNGIVDALFVFAACTGLILGAVLPWGDCIFNKCKKHSTNIKSSLNDPILDDDSQATQLYTQ